MPKADRRLVLLVVALIIFSINLIEMDKSQFGPRQSVSEESIPFIHPSTSSYSMTSSNPAYNIEVLVLDAVTNSPVECATMHLQDMEVAVDERGLVGYAANEQGAIFASVESGWYGTDFSCDEQQEPPFYPVYINTGDIFISEDGEVAYFAGSHDFMPNEAGVLVVRMEMICLPPLEGAPGVEVELYGETCLHYPVD